MEACTRTWSETEIVLIYDDFARCAIDISYCENDENFFSLERNADVSKQAINVCELGYIV